MAKWLEKEVLSLVDGAQLIEEWQSARCSACGKYHTTPYMYYFDEYKFCPNCGEAMDGKDINVRSRSKTMTDTSKQAVVEEIRKVMKQELGNLPTCLDEDGEEVCEDMDAANLILAINKKLGEAIWRMK
jgi:predicted RNA-binding Zn-ribbon protein involved in translation (DUF1610 family)